MWLGSASAGWLLLGVVAFELPLMLREGGLRVVAAHPALFLLASAMGFVVNATAYFVIKLNSSLTLKARPMIPFNALDIFLCPPAARHQS